MIGPKRLPRLAVRSVSFLAVSMFLWPLPIWDSSSKYILAFSPFTAISTSVALRAIGVGSAVGLMFGAIAWMRHRWICRYICPVGLLLEGIGHLGLQKNAWWSRCPQIGKKAALLTFAGAIFGYPLLLWMDPFAIFSSFLGLRSAASLHSGILQGCLLVILVLVTLLAGQVWCARICPLGGTQELLTSARARWQGKQFKPDSERSDSLSPWPAVARRSLILAAAGIGITLFAKKLGAMRGERAPLRPPGAVGEEQFAGLCQRCGQCLRACPSQIIHPDTGIGGVPGLLAPTIQYGKKYCLEDCYACTRVCPSGAIQKLDLAQKRKYIIGEALVDGSLCFVTLGTKDCDACARACPFDAVKIHWDEERYVAYPLVSTEKCNGCGACEVVCPTGQIKAIRVWKRADQATLN